MIPGHRLYSDANMWFCECCGHSVSRDEIISEYYPATRYEPAEITLICPICGSTDTLEEAPYECDCCGDRFPHSEMSNTDGLCKRCAVIVTAV